MKQKNWDAYRVLDMHRVRIKTSLRLSLKHYPQTKHTVSQELYVCFFPFHKVALGIRVHLVAWVNWPLLWYPVRAPLSDQHLIRRTLKSHPFLQYCFFVTQPGKSWGEKKVYKSTSLKTSGHWFKKTFKFLCTLRIHSIQGLTRNAYSNSSHNAYTF